MTPLGKFCLNLNTTILKSDSLFSPIQRGSLRNILGSAEHLSRIAPVFFDEILRQTPKTLKVAEIDPFIQDLIDKGVYRFVYDKEGNLLPTIFGEKGIVAQVRLKDMQIPQDYRPVMVDLLTQIALTQIINAIRDVQNSVDRLHSELQNDRLALADSSWQQLQQAAQIIDSRVREAKLLSIQSRATDAKCQLFRTFAEQKRFFDERAKSEWYNKMLDQTAPKQGDAKSREIFETLVAVTTAVQVEVITYCLLGEQHAAHTSLEQFSQFISDYELNNRETLILFDSFSHSTKKHIIDGFMQIQHDIRHLPLDTERRSITQRSDDSDTSNR
jgi:hypothetical protein